MSYDNNSNNNSYNDNDYMNSQWQGSTWSDDYYSNRANNPATNYNTADFTRTNQRVGFEENVLTQSFAFMAVALIITAITAFFVYSSPRLIVNIIMNEPLFYGLLFSEIIIVMIANFTVSRNLLVPSAILFTLYSVVNGATLSIIFVAYTPGSIASTFLIAAIMFGGMAIYGIKTKKDLTSIGSLCLMALWGIIIASIVNLVIFKSSMFEMIVSVIGILLFIGITAYDAQKIKNLVYTTDTDNVTCIALLGAIELYLDFINIFLKLLMLLGRRND